MKRTNLLIWFAVVVFLVSAACQAGGLIGMTDDTSEEPASQPAVDQVVAGTAEPEPTQAPQADEQTLSSGSGSVVLRALDATRSQYPRTVKAEVYVAESETPSQVEMLYEADGIYRVAVTNPDGSLFETVVITPTVYVNMGGVWSSFNGEQASSYVETFRDIDNPVTDAQTLSGSEPPVVAGSESVAGAQTTIYTFSNTLSDGVISNAKLWIGDADSLVYRYEVEASNGTRTYGEYDYTTPVNIEPPAKEGDGSQDPAANNLGSGTELCSLAPVELVAGIIERDIQGSPEPFEDDYLGYGCQYNFGSDSQASYFAYIAIAPISSFEDSRQNGYQVQPVPELVGQEAFRVNGADAEQLWVKIDESRALVIAIGDQPNSQAALALALVLPSFLLALP